MARKQRDIECMDEPCKYFAEGFSKLTLSLNKDPNVKMSASLLNTLMV